ncbi:MAG: cupin domain-containing protein [Geminicoccaceae bacterium]
MVDVIKAASRPTNRGNVDYFTGTVWQDPVIQAQEPARVWVARVTFEPGARTYWHTHPLGQTLHVLSGVGRVQSDGGPVHELLPGDTVWIKPDEKHWHGAAPNNLMTHMAIHEAKDGSYIDWLEEVSDGDYNRAPAD